MAKKQQSHRRSKRSLAGLWIFIGLAVAAVVVAVSINNANKGDRPRIITRPNNNLVSSASSTTNAQPSTMEVAKAVMVTVELDFGPNIPSIAEALRHIERRYEPADGKGRTFAILDAYGEPTPAGKLHISMHVSSEKPGMAALVFKRTGEVLWQSKIIPSTNAAPFSGKELTILMDDGAGKTLMIDGSKNPSSILDAGIRNSPSLVRDVWPEGGEREFTYIFSACGCPVKTKVRREGDRTVRTTEFPVMFPDDPAVMRVITQLMRW